MSENVIIGLWVLSSVYCLFKLFKRSKAVSFDGVTGYSPGLEAIMVVMLGPLLAVIDISLTWIRIYKEAEEARRRSKS